MSAALKQMPEVYLAPGEFRFATSPTRLRTILGSCVAVTLWHPERKIGGMCHYMLPSRARCSTALNGMYADEAIELFVRQAKAHRTEPEGERRERQQYEEADVVEQGCDGEHRE